LTVYLSPKDKKEIDVQDTIDVESEPVDVEQPAAVG
jgi:hypothetical protein